MDKCIVAGCESQSSEHSCFCEKHLNQSQIYDNTMIQMWDLQKQIRSLTDELIDLEHQKKPVHDLKLKTPRRKRLSEMKQQFEKFREILVRNELDIDDE